MTGPAAPQAAPSARRLGIEAALVAAFVFLVAAWGACRTIYVGDSGELVAAVSVLGIPHPSGYPLYVLLGKLWTLLLPIGSIAYRMSLFSVACTAAACGLLHHLLRRLGRTPRRRPWPRCYSPSRPASGARPTCSVSTRSTCCSWSWSWPRRSPGSATGEDRLLLLACFLCGLGATNHTFMGLVAFAVGIFALVTRPGLLRRPRLLVAMPAAAIVGLLPYAYLPLRSRMDPPLDWGNPETFSAFMNVVLRRDFWNRSWAEGPADAIPIAADYLSSIGYELLIAGAVLAVVGVVAARRRGAQRWPVVLPLLVMAANAFAVGLHGSRSDIFIWHRYYIPSYAMAALLAGLGCAGGARARGAAPPGRLAALGVAAAGACRPSVWSCTGASSTAAATGSPTTSRASCSRRCRRGRTSRRATTTSCSCSIYLQLVEGLRPDVDLILQGVASRPRFRFHEERAPLHLGLRPQRLSGQLRRR